MNLFTKPFFPRLTAVIILKPDVCNHTMVCNHTVTEFNILLNTAAKHHVCLFIFHVHVIWVDL